MTQLLSVCSRRERVVSIVLINQCRTNGTYFCYTLTMTVIGYARVSTADQSLDRQVDELTAAGAEEVRTETGSGKKGAPRPVWEELLRNIRSRGHTDGHGAFTTRSLD